jgi:hypothetical protein
MSKDNDAKPENIIIEGRTKAGKAFRPSDWAERMSGRLATFKNRRIHYSPMLQPSVNKEGYKCVVLSPSLKDSNPELYQSIIEFAQENNLKLNIDSEGSED